MTGRRGGRAAVAVDGDGTGVSMAPIADDGPGDGAVDSADYYAGPKGDDVVGGGGAGPDGDGATGTVYRRDRNRSGFWAMVAIREATL